MVVLVPGPGDGLRVPAPHPARGLDLDVVRDELAEGRAVVAAQGADHALGELRFAHPGGSGSRRVPWTRRPRSRSWISSTGAGAPVSRSEPDAVFGNAITSRIEPAPASRWTKRSRPYAMP